MREKIMNAMKAAMKAKEGDRLSTIRLINAAIKDRDIALRGEGHGEEISDADILAVLGKMIKQRQESAKLYDEAARLELAQRERDEISVIEEFLPQQLSAEEIDQAIRDAIAQTGAQNIRDMGKVMGVLKEKYVGKMDFAKAGPMVKAHL